jgi:hypothetical protein
MKEDDKNFEIIANQLNRMDIRLSEVQTDIGEIKVTLVLNTKDLAEHMRRTNLLEDKVNLEKALRDSLQEKAQERLEKLELPAKSLKYFIKLIGIFSLIVTAILGGIKLFGGF